MNAYEEPTNEFRQVRRKIDYTYKDYDPCSMGLGPAIRSGTISVVETIQRKWIVHEEDGLYSQEVPGGFVVYSSRSEGLSTKGRYEWRDVPTVDDPKAL